MSLVNTTTGEIVDILESTEALDLCQNITRQIDTVNIETGALIELVADALKGRAWVSLGYGSWEALCDAMRWEFRPSTSTDRAALAKTMRESGMSLRAIGRLIGAGKDTVQRDLSGVANETPAEVHGADGKTYPASRPTHAEPEPVAERDDEERPEEPRFTIVPDTSDVVSTSDVVTFTPVTWRKHPAAKRSDNGRDICAWLDQRSIKGDLSNVVDDYAAKCPAEIAEQVAAHALAQATAWRRLADRVANQKPSLGVVQ